jgi:hypothetical protein
MHSAAGLSVFCEEERRQLCALPGVGAGILRRLEALGLSSLQQLGTLDAHGLTHRLALANCSDCWISSSVAQQRIAAIIALAQATQRRNAR